MKSLSTAIITIMALGLTNPAFAEDGSEGNGDGFFVGAGGVMYDNNDLIGVQGTVGYNFAKYFGVEGVISTGVVDTDVPGTSLSVGVDSSFAGFGTLRMANDQYSVYVKGGYHSTKFGATGPITGNLTLDGIAGGIGFDWYFNKSSGVRMEAVSYDTKDLNVQGVNGMTLISLSYLHKF